MPSLLLRCGTIAVTLVLCTACGGTTVSGSGGATTTNSTSSSTSGIAIPADGAWSVALTNNGATCHTLSDTVAVGEVTASAILTRVTDGTQGASVVCSVTPATNVAAFTVDGTAALGADTLHITIPSITATATQASPAVGSVEFAAPQTNGATYTGHACDFYFVADTGEGVAAGKVWIAFDCQSVSGSGSTCSLAQSIALFEDCAATGG
jgi:hypothetical protein